MLPANISRVDTMAFSRCERLEYVDLRAASSLKSLGKCMFFGCPKLRRVLLGEGLQKISCECFANSGVEEIELPHSVRCIEDKAFRCCKDLKRIVADGVEVIGEYAFAESGLESFCASSSLRQIKSCAFTDCKALKHVDLRN